MKYSIGTVLVCLVFVRPALAQVPDVLPARSIALDSLWLVNPVVVEPVVINEPELGIWIHDYKAWLEWAEQWLNRRQWALHPFPYPFWKDTPYVFSYVAPPQVKPEPPMWLEAACVDGVWRSNERGAFAEGCTLLAMWKDDYSTQRIRGQIANARTQKDAHTRTAFFEHIHFASLWTNLGADAGPRAYGLAGMHATLDIRGRWQIYAFPGVMVVRVPNRQREQITTIGYDWGFAIRLFDLRLPLFDVPARAHLNVVEVWMPEIEQKIDMVGLSFTLKRKP